MQLRILSASCYKRTPRMLHETRNSLFPYAITPIGMAAASLCGIVVVLAVSTLLRGADATAITVEEACQQTKHPEFCVKALSSAKPEMKTSAGQGGLPALAELSLSLAAESGAETVSFVKNLAKMPGGMPTECLEECVGKFQAAVADLRRSKVALEEARDVSGVKAWVSAAKTDGDTCMDDCQRVEGGSELHIVDKIGELGKLCSIALSLTDASLRNRAA
ncbi:pectinesterase inhibitor 3-like [Phragmites australis]|uniref:pectinesterase inhibitor 3-like n=1 Tax=Phragmites australis TaxID=29695 RepID=UPI002D79E244|nr:pectinesterase inhibitor 3-like [Phragmites australis]